MTGDQYLRSILLREMVDTSPYSPVLAVQHTVNPLVTAWAGNHLVGIRPSGSFAKGTANRSGTDIDLFVSLSSTVPLTLKLIYGSLFETFQQSGYSPRGQNVSIGIRVGGFDVDIVPAKRQDAYSHDHSLYRRRAETWTKTNVHLHVQKVSQSGRTEEIRVLKLWRDQKQFAFPSFYLELTTITALSGRLPGNVAQNVWSVLAYIRDNLANARVVDPANTNNVISDDLNAAEKASVVRAAHSALAAQNWSEIVK